VAQRVFGIDLGSYAVKVAVMDVGFRVSRLIQVHTFPVPGGPESALLRSLDVLSGLPRPQPTEVVAVGMPGDRVLLRLLEIPFTEPRKLGAVVGNELADDIPWELEQVVFDFATVPDVPGRVVAALAQSAEVRLLLDRLGEQGMDPRQVVVGPLCYAGLVREMVPQGSVMVVDMGHTTTNMCHVINGRVAGARTVSRGGHQVTDALRQAFQLSYEEAEQLKERDGFVALDEASLPPDRRALASTVAGAVAPLTREVRLTVGLFGARLSRTVDQLLLCGGTSLLRGLDEYLAQELQIPTRRLDLTAVTEESSTTLTPEGEAMAAAAMGIAVEQGGRHGINLRQGEFAFKTDRSVFTEKLVQIAVSVVAILVFAALSAYMSLNALRKEEKRLTVQLQQATKETLGEEIKNPRTVSKLLQKGCRPRSFAIPQQTAFDILDRLSRDIPGKDKVKLDIVHLDIKPGKTYVKGTADSRSAVGDIVKALEKNKCFSKIATGRISDVADGKKQFSLTINTECF